MLTVGVDVGGTSVRAGLVDDSGRVLELRREPTPSHDCALEEVILALIGDLIAGRTVTAVGLALAGFVSRDQRRVLFAPHLSWRSVPVVDRLTDRLGLPVFVEHDANAALLAEHRIGAARGARVAVLIAIGTGIGTALLVDGALFRGAHGVAPELGHLTLVPGGRPCSCGKRGCWERYCSGTALAETAVELLAARNRPSTLGSPEGERQLTGRAVAGAARRGDPLALEAIGDLARWLGVGLAVVSDVYDPETVLVAGGVAGSAGLFLDQAREHYAAVLTGAGHRPLARIRPARLGADAAIIGAGLLAGKC